MPIYEFLCPECNTLYKFFSRTVNTDRIPACPSGASAHVLERRVSLFAVSSGKGEESDTADELPVDESKVAGAMEKLMGEAQNINEDDPRQAARFMQKFSDMTGLKYNDSIQEALGRMEAGEDPEAVEAQMGDALNDENPFTLQGRKSGRGSAAPRRDETLYEM